MNNELIIYNNGNPVIEPKTAVAIADLERELKALKEKSDNIKAALLKAMEDGGVYKLSTPELDVTYIAASKRERFDAKEFREACPDLYDEFVKISPVAASVRVKLK